MKENKSKGITLISLVVTIIILILLAGITISQLTENGIISKAKKSEEETIKAEMKEDISKAILELQIQEKGNATIDGITQNWADELLSKYKPTITESDSRNSKILEMSKNKINARYKITENLEIEDISAGVNIIATYEILSCKEDSVLQLLIKIENKEGNIEEVKCPNGKIIQYTDKNIVNINWEAIDGERYDFIVTSNGKNETCTIQTKGMTRNNPIEISSVNDLLELRKFVNDYGYNFQNKDINLKCDLDLSSACYKVDGTSQNDISWIPIGNSTTNFSGNFNGNGHKINNLYINKNTYENCQGLFGYASNGKISNLTLDGTILIDEQYSNECRVGAISGICVDEIIEKCTNYTNINAYKINVLGGIAGLVEEYNNSKINKCINYGNINGMQNVGGIVGDKNYGNVEISECCNFGTVTTTGFQIGGILGGAFGGTTVIRDCYNTGKIVGTNIYNGRIGGIIGIGWPSNGAENVNISNCYNIGEISKYAWSGGIIGYQGCTATYSNCYFDNSFAQGATTGIEAVDAETLKTYANILGEYFTNDSKNINNGYPILKFQN